MRNTFYQKLAAQNIRRNKKNYVPYMLTCICAIAMFFICMSLSGDQTLAQMKGGGSVTQVLFLGTIVVGIFSAVVLFYTNSFLMKRRKQELGLYNVLGMERRHIAIVLLWESVFMYGICLVLGIASGLLFQQLVYLLLLRILQLAAPLQVTLALKPVLYTVVLFLLIFCLLLLNTMLQVRRSQPIALLREANAGEREPKTKWLLTCIGIVSLGAGYAIALTVEKPMQAMYLFFVAVLLVIIGTYCLFTAGSVALLKALRKNKRYYYQQRHFVGVSGMIYRMKQNAVGLASICILSTAVLVMLSSTVSLYLGMEDIIRTRFPRNLAVTVYGVGEAESERYRSAIGGYLDEQGIGSTDTVEYTSFDTHAVYKNGSFYKTAAGEEMGLTFITIGEYNRLQNANDTLSDGQAYLYCLHGNIPENTLQFEDLTLQVVKRLESFPLDGIKAAYIYTSLLIVVPDTATIHKLWSTYHYSTTLADTFTYHYMFDTDVDAQTQIQLKGDLATLARETVSEERIAVTVESAAESRESMFGLYGSLFFLGLFLGLLFLVATVLIIYYKQVSEGYEDKARYRIMRNVGMSRTQVRRAIRSQVLTVFFIPLLMAVVHIIVAFPVITKLLELLNLFNTTLFFWCTVGCIGAFALVYMLIYNLSARAYYSIVD